MAAAIISTPAHVESTKLRTPLAADTVIAGRYRIVNLLGEGATGTVYATEHVLLHKRIALKILHPELTDTPEGVARFEREAMATSRIEHPNVAAAVDFGKLDDGSMYLALEFVEGTSLRDEIAKGPMGLERSLYIARQIASAIAAAQALDIVHRDMKPENIMLVTKGSDADFVKVLDFGIAHVPVNDATIGGPQGLTKVGAVFGTAEYMPPEQGIGQKVDTRADLYALGVILFEMVSGVRPYAVREDLGILAQQLTLAVPTIAERAPGIEVPPSLQRLINRLLAKRPQERIAKAEELVRAIDGIIAGDATGQSVAPSANATDEPLPAFALQTQLPGVLTPPNSDNLPAAVADAHALPAQVPSERAPEAKVERAPSAATASSKASASLAKSLRQMWETVTSGVDARRQVLPEPLRTRLARVSASTLVAAFLAAVVVTVTLIGIAAHRARAAAAADAAASASALRAAEEAAAKASAEASKPAQILDASKVTPEPDSKDPNVMLDQAEKKLKENKDSEAVNLVARVLGKHPDRRNDTRVANILFATASSMAKGVSNTAFSLLEGTMAAPGAEIVYQLAVDRSVPSFVRARAEKWMHTPQFDRAASDALRIAAKLRLASTCEGKRALLPSAAKVGGAAALAIMHELQGESGCGLSGKSDCYPCLRSDTQLSDAIKGIEARLR